MGGSVAVMVIEKWHIGSEAAAYRIGWPSLAAFFLPQSFPLCFCVLSSNIGTDAVADGVNEIHTHKGTRRDVRRWKTT